MIIMDVALGNAPGLMLQTELCTSATEIFVLTGQEIECLRWCKEGKTNWEIGAILRISEKTVEFHLGNAMKKLGAGNRITAVVRALKLGLIAL
jgi:DNA-binding CsgD family transcriptional regulator